MAAAVSEVRLSQWREPEGRGHELLQLWALYRRGGERGHSPFVSGYLKEPLDKAHDGEPEEVMTIDRVLAALCRADCWHSVEIVKRYYLSETPVAKITEDMHRTEGFVRLTLRGICALVEEKVPE